MDIRVGTILLFGSIAIFFATSRALSVRFTMMMSKPSSSTAPEETVSTTVPTGSIPAPAAAGTVADLERRLQQLSSAEPAAAPSFAVPPVAKPAEDSSAKGGKNALLVRLQR